MNLEAFLDLASKIRSIFYSKSKGIYGLREAIFVSLVRRIFYFKLGGHLGVLNYPQFTHSSL